MRKGFRYMPVKHTLPKKKKAKVVVKQTVKEMLEEAGTDVKVLNRKIHLSCLLADIIEGYFTDIQSEVHRVDSTATLPMMRAINSVLLNTKDIRKMVDGLYDDDSKFGDLSDKLKEELERITYGGNIED